MGRRGIRLRGTLPRFLHFFSAVCAVPDTFNVVRGGRKRNSGTEGESRSRHYRASQNSFFIFASDGALSDTFMSSGREGKEKWEGGDITLAAHLASHIRKVFRDSSGVMFMGEEGKRERGKRESQRSRHDSLAGDFLRSEDGGDGDAQVVYKARAGPPLLGADEGPSHHIRRRRRRTPARSGRSPPPGPRPRPA